LHYYFGGIIVSRFFFANTTYFYRLDSAFGQSGKQTLPIKNSLKTLKQDQTFVFTSHQL
jgi:hypothetical protein